MSTCLKGLPIPSIVEGVLPLAAIYGVFTKIHLLYYCFMSPQELTLIRLKESEQAWLGLARVTTDTDTPSRAFISVDIGIKMLQNEVLRLPTVPIVTPMR